MNKCVYNSSSLKGIAGAVITHVERVLACARMFVTFARVILAGVFLHKNYAFDRSDTCSRIKELFSLNEAAWGSLEKDGGRVEMEPFE